MKSRPDPILIQGGMGAAVSSWPLAKAVAKTGQLGVVSGTALDVVLARRLQIGDPNGDVRRAMKAFPRPETAAKLLDRYFIPGGKPANAPFRPIPMASHHPTLEQIDLLVVANFVEVFLAKQGHNGLVGINYLEKIQLPTLPSLFGAMLAGVDYVLMGAGIPKSIPGILDRICRGESVELVLDVQDARRDEPFISRLDPREIVGGDCPRLERPRFLAIVASATLATMLARKASGHVDGFVVEGPSAGGHNAPPRGEVRLNNRGEPIYGKRDELHLEAFRALGRPFWLAGSYGSPERLLEALDAGAAGVQVGTAFAFCDESGLRTDIKRDVLAMARSGAARVSTDPAVSPTGFPFKVLSLPGTLSDAACYDSRSPVCDLGYLRRGYRRDDGRLDWRCPAEDVEAYVRKGGDRADTVGRKCVCNALLANVGLGQQRSPTRPELPLVTCGDDVNEIVRFLPSPEADGYTAASVVSRLLADLEAANSVSMDAPYAATRP